ncbi:MAG: mgtA 1 [Phycisphaerales bacterium]|nr:mgtA 1 [Phycisphaerales bacterium]
MPGASAFLPFVPTAPIQVVANDLLYDFSRVPIPSGPVDKEQVAQPRPMDVDEIRRFNFCVGPISSVFDYATFALLPWVFSCWAGGPGHAAPFQTKWFVKSLVTQTPTAHVIRANRTHFLRSRRSWPLVTPRWRSSGSASGSGSRRWHRRSGSFRGRCTGRYCRPPRSATLA